MKSLQNFMTCIVEGRQPESGFAEARLVCELIYAAYISAEEGRAVDLETLAKEMAE